MKAAYFLGEKWLGEYIQIMADRGLTVDKMPHKINKWLRAAIAYQFWLLDEEFSDADCDAAMETALWKADFDLQKFPKCSHET